jgi:general secretion pathway protein G
MLKRCLRFILGNRPRNIFFHAPGSWFSWGIRHIQKTRSQFIIKLVIKGRREIIAGFTLLELLTVIAILGTIAAIAVPAYSYYIDKARITKAISEVGILQKEIIIYELDKDALPDTLDDIGRGNFLDPYGNPYQYMSFADQGKGKGGKGKGGKGAGKKRKDQWDNPLNDDFDLYSMGRDGMSAQHLNNPKSHDDIIRVHEGRFIGLVSEY